MTSDEDEGRSPRLVALEARALAAEADLRRLRIWLLRHAQHAPECVGDRRFVPCSCGLADLLGEAVAEPTPARAVECCYHCGRAHDPLVACATRKLTEGWSA